MLVVVARGLPNVESISYKAQKSGPKLTSLFRRPAPNLKRLFTRVERSRSIARRPARNARGFSGSWMNAARVSRLWWPLDQFARSVKHLVNALTSFERRASSSFRFGAIDTATAVGKAMLTIIGAMSNSRPT